MVGNYDDFSCTEVCPLSEKSGMECGKEDYPENAEGKVYILQDISFYVSSFTVDLVEIFLVIIG